jgi:hypothetical protein
LRVSKIIISFDQMKALGWMQRGKTGCELRYLKPG